MKFLRRVCLWNILPEDFEYKKNSYDTVFTSPPYFNVERYSYDDTQSWVRYKTIDEWNKNFLQHTLKKIWPSIKRGGYLLVNISDVYASSGGSKKWLEICNPMNDFLSQHLVIQSIKVVLEWRWLNDLIVVGAGTAAEERFKDETKELAEQTKDKTFCEPIWVWKKY